MARLGGVDLPKQKRVEIGLTYIFGIGLTRSKEILAKTGISADVRVKDLSEEDVVKLRDILREYHIEGDLRREIGMNIKRKMEVACYQGQRHRKKLPVRGQRTKTNGRTNRTGKKKTVANKKKAVK